MASSADTRPGRAAITTIRCDRNTDSKTEWVTKSTVMARRCHRCQVSHRHCQTGYRAFATRAGFELVESALDNVDGAQRKATERALMAYRQGLQDGLPATRLAPAASRSAARARRASVLSPERSTPKSGPKSAASPSAFCS